MTVEEDKMRTEHDLDEMLDRHEDNPVLAGLSSNGRAPWRLRDVPNKYVSASPEEVEHRRRLVSQLLDQNYSYREIAEMLQASHHVIEKDIVALGKRRKINPAGVGERGRKLQAMQQALVADYEAGVDMETLVERYGIKRDTIKTRLRAAGVWVSLKATPEKIAALVHDWQQGMDVTELAEKHGISKSTVRSWLAKSGARHQERRLTSSTQAKTVTLHSLTEMAKFADLILNQDLSRSMVDEEEAEVWELACRKIGKAINKARRNIKKGNEQ